MRSLLSPKWHTEGYLWSLEYLSYRVTEITDCTLREQDQLFKITSSSLPSNLNDLCILMGIGASDPEDATLKNYEARLFSRNRKVKFTNEFIELINQIYLENDFTNKNNILDYSKRKKYEANFQTRIR